MYSAPSNFHYKGMAAEYKVRYRLLAASLAGVDLADLVTNPCPGAGLGEEPAATLTAAGILILGGPSRAPGRASCKAPERFPGGAGVS